MMNSEIDSGRKTASEKDFKSGMRCLSASVTLITVAGPQGRNGLTATAVCSVSATPPTLLVSVSRDASAHKQLLQERRFAVNILRPEHRALADRFSSGDIGESRFETGQWRTGCLGLPVLGDALASFECEVSEVIDAGTHDIFLGRVVNVIVADGKPLLYGGGQYATVLPSAAIPGQPIV
jgi:flavin reductase (DIM6/NTAB) family NADH-FMN oxidoreductase RutF